jgi:hypothetical protein
MMELTFKVKDDQLANLLSYLGEELTEMDTPFAKRWKEYTPFQRKVILQCKEMMEKGVTN